MLQTTNGDALYHASSATYPSDDLHVMILIAIAIAFLAACMLAMAATIISMIVDKRKFGTTQLTEERMFEIKEMLEKSASEKTEPERPWADVTLNWWSRNRNAVMTWLVIFYCLFCPISLFLGEAVAGVDTYAVSWEPRAMLIQVVCNVPTIPMLVYMVFMLVCCSKQGKTNERSKRLLDYAKDLGIEDATGIVPPHRRDSGAASVVAGFAGFTQPLATGYMIFLFGCAAKPVIYLYPEEETDVTVSLDRADSLTCSYPLYDAERPWRVKASPDGTLCYLDGASGRDRELYCLYYENELPYRYRMTREGFCVARDDIPAFLEDKLAVLGLSEREAEEFIIYWLPRLQQKPYAYIRFADERTIRDNMELSIEPAPDTLIRVLMLYKPLSRPRPVVNQQLHPASRNGFTVVEWGGTEIR